MFHIFLINSEIQMIENIPKSFLDLSVQGYPIHNKSIGIEEYFYKFFKNKNIETDLTYLPIQWTNYFVKNKYGKEIDELKNFTKALNFNEKKYFTVTQYDGGPLVNLNNTIVFSCSGMFNTPKNNNLSHINIPLLTQKYRIPMRSKKDYKVGYIGRNTHSIRKKIIDMYINHEGYKLINFKEQSASAKDNKFFKKLTSRSMFTLCPRGYGPTSFRLYESINLQSIPVYISDEFILPFQNVLDWEKLAIILKEDEIHLLDKKINSILDSKKYNEMLDYGKECNSKFFNMEYTSNYILKTVQLF